MLYFLRVYIHNSYVLTIQYIIDLFSIVSRFDRFYYLMLLLSLFYTDFHCCYLVRYLIFIRLLLFKHSIYTHLLCACTFRFNLSKLCSMHKNLMPSVSVYKEHAKNALNRELVCIKGSALYSSFFFKQ
jgi:hypothetical protein